MFPPEETLKEFLRKAHANTYAAGDRGRVPVPSRLASTEYRFEEGKFLYVDIYFGARTFIGQEVVYYDSVPIWTMIYQGSLQAGVKKSVGFGFLRQALLVGVEVGEFLRGPEEWTDGGQLKYVRDFRPGNGLGSDNLYHFSGWENIYQKDNAGNSTRRGIYQCYFRGGAIEE